MLPRWLTLELDAKPFEQAMATFIWLMKERAEPDELADEALALIGSGEAFECQTKYTKSFPIATIVVIPSKRFLTLMTRAMNA